MTIRLVPPIIYIVFLLDKYVLIISYILCCKIMNFRNVPACSWLHHAGLSWCSPPGACNLGCRRSAQRVQASPPVRQLSHGRPVSDNRRVAPKQSNKHPVHSDRLPLETPLALHRAGRTVADADKDAGRSRSVIS